MLMELRVNRRMTHVLDELAAPRGLTRVQVLRRAVLLLKYLSDAAVEGREVLVRDPVTGCTERLLLEG